MKIIVSIGDCNGIGLETFIKALYFNNEMFKNTDNVSFSIVGNQKTIEEYIHFLKLDVKVINSDLIIKDISCKILQVPEYSPVELGHGTYSSGLLSAKAIEYAANATIKGEFDALLTLPVSKKALYSAGWKFPGHTEMLANSCNVEEPLMILFKDNFRVTVATLHIPLKHVPKNISKNTLTIVAKKFYESLQIDFGIIEPKIAVLGLNPHSGENGAIGKEEKKIIEPILHKIKNEGIWVEGPYSADGFFAHDWTEAFDGVIAMYHDQGLIPLKQFSKGAGVNFTAGLPIVRTSPSHGTAYDIAGKNIANWQSTFEAIHSAIMFVKNREIYKKKINN